MMTKNLSLLRPADISQSAQTCTQHVENREGKGRILNPETVALVQLVLPQKGLKILEHLLGSATCKYRTVQQDDLVVDICEEVILKIPSIAKLAKTAGSPCATETYHKMLLVLEALEVIKRYFHRTWTEIRIPLRKRAFSRSRLLSSLKKLELEYKNIKVKQIAKKAAKRIQSSVFFADQPRESVPVAPMSSLYDDLEPVKHLMRAFLEGYGVEVPMPKIQEICQSIAALLQPQKYSFPQGNVLKKIFLMDHQTSLPILPNINKPSTAICDFPNEERKLQCDSVKEKGVFAEDTRQQNREGGFDANNVTKELDAYMGIGKFQSKESHFPLFGYTTNSQKEKEESESVPFLFADSLDTSLKKRVVDPKSEFLPNDLPSVVEKASFLEEIDLNNLSNVNVSTVIINCLNNVNVRNLQILAGLLGTIFNEPRSKWGIYVQHLKHYSQPEAIVSALIQTLRCQLHDGTLQNPPAFFLARSKVYHLAIPDDVRQLVKRYETLSYGELVEVLKHSLPFSTENSMVQTKKNQPKEIKSSALQAIKAPLLHIQLEKDKASMSWEEATALYKFLCNDARMVMCKKFIVPVDTTKTHYVLLLDATISSKVRQTFLYSHQEWCERSQGMRTCLSLFESPETLQYAKNRFLSLREMLKKVR